MARQHEPEEQEVFEIRRAVRRRVPQIMAIYGPTFSGKTYGALLLAAGLIEPGERIGFIDTENGRGLMYADDPDIQRLYPDSYDVIELHPPFHPRRYIAANRQLVESGCALVITDSGSHAWEGEGGCQDIKEQDKAWNNAKLWNKRFSAALRYSPAHQIVCLRAQEKTKVVDKKDSPTGKQLYIPLGIMPICEKSFPFDLGLSFEVEGEIEGRPATHFAHPKKWPKAMNGLFNNWEPQLLTVEVGRRIREWNNSAGKETHSDVLRKQARAAAYEGMDAYAAFFGSLSVADKKIIFDTDHATNKANAQQIDIETAARNQESEDPESPQPNTEADKKFFADVA
jgi:hypothetical protein